MPAHLPWGEDELQKLIALAESRVFRDQRKIPVVLQPIHLHDLKSAVRDLLNESVNSYDKALDGILLSYKHLKVLSKSASVSAETSGVVLEIQADFFVFRPEIGCILNGVVNKISKDHVGVLVYNRFNVSCPRPSSESRSEKWLGNYVVMHQEVTFKLKDKNFSGRLPFFKGKLISIGEITHTVNETDKLGKKKKKEVAQTLNASEPADAVSTLVSRNRKHKLEKFEFNDASQSKRPKKNSVGSSVQANVFDSVANTPVPIEASESKKMKVSALCNYEKSTINPMQDDSTSSKKKKKKIKISVGCTEGNDYIPRLSLDVSQLPEHLPPPNADSTHFDLAKNDPNVLSKSEKKKRSKETHSAMSTIQEESAGTQKNLSKLISQSMKGQESQEEKVKKKKGKKSGKELINHDLSQVLFDNRKINLKSSENEKKYLVSQPEPPSTLQSTRVEQIYSQKKKKQKSHESILGQDLSKHNLKRDDSVSNELQDVAQKKKQKTPEALEAAHTKEKKAKKNKAFNVLPSTELSMKEIQPGHHKISILMSPKVPSAECLNVQRTTQSKKTLKIAEELFSPLKHKKDKVKELQEKPGTDADSDDTIPPGQKLARKSDGSPTKRASFGSTSFGKSPGIGFLAPSSSTTDFDLGTQKGGRHVPIFIGNLEGKKVPPPESPMKSPEKRARKHESDSDAPQPKRVVISSSVRNQSSDSESDYGNEQSTSAKFNLPNVGQHSSESDSDTAVKSKLLQSMGVMQSPLKTAKPFLKQNSSDSESEGSVDGDRKHNIVSRPISKTNSKLSSKIKASFASEIKSPPKKASKQSKSQILQKSNVSQGTKSISSPRKVMPAPHAAESDSDSDLEVMKNALLQLEHERLLSKPRSGKQKQAKVGMNKGSIKKSPNSRSKSSVTSCKQTVPKNISSISNDSDSGPDDRNTTALIEEMRQMRAIAEKNKKRKPQEKQVKVPHDVGPAANAKSGKKKDEAKGKKPELKEKKSETEKIKNKGSKEDTNKQIGKKEQPSDPKPKGKKKASTDEEISDVMQRLIREARLNIGLA